METDVLEDLVLHGTRDHIFFASGSTKTVEFTHLMEWLDGLLGAEHPAIRGRPVRINVEPVLSLRSSMIVANRVDIEIEGGPSRHLYLLARVSRMRPAQSNACVDYNSGFAQWKGFHQIEIHFPAVPASR